MEEDFLKTVGGNIKRIRKQRGWSLDKLAIGCGFEKSRLSKLEAGKCNVTLKTLFRLAVTLDVTAGQFFNVMDEVRKDI